MLRPIPPRERALVVFVAFFQLYHKRCCSSRLEAVMCTIKGSKFDHPGRIRPSDFSLDTLPSLVIK